ncbi:MAG: hypothetical protein MN733_07295 [Nitrososphaera sp.]|nr:hypothetical protein [Nitrososphaera sp.]
MPESVTIPPAESVEYLRATDVGKGATIKILSEPRTSNSQYAKGGWDVDVQIGKAKKVWTIKPNSGNHARLWKLFKSAWKGKSVKVVVKQYAGKDYVAVAD